MVKLIVPGDGRGLNQLDMHHGALVGFKGTEKEYSAPFILARSVGLFSASGHMPTNTANRVFLSHKPLITRNDEWILYTIDFPLELQDPREMGRWNIPEIKKRVKEDPYHVESAYVGGETIVEALKQIPGFSIYHAWIESELIRHGRPAGR